MIRKLFLMLVPALLVACTPVPPASPGDLPGVSTVCAGIKSDKFDLALHSYGVAVDAVNLLITTKAVVPGTPRALAIANANDRVLAAFSTAEHARQACNSAGYAAAIDQIYAGIAAVQFALK